MRSFRSLRSMTFVLLRAGLAAALVTAMVVAVPVPLAPAATTQWWVDDDGSDSNAGTEAAPFATIAKAMSVASAGHRIWVEPGTYPQSSVIGHKPGVWMESTGGADVTVIQANGSNPCVIMTNPIANTALKGFTLTNGSWAMGGGMSVHRTAGLGTLLGWPLIAENTITKNVATTNEGGGIYFEAPSTSPFQPIVENNEIRDNDAATSGGGIFCTAYVSPTVRGNRFFFNEADSGGAFLAINQSVPRLEGNTFVANKALTGAGGAIYLSLLGGSPVISGNTIIGNQAQQYGGACFISSCNPVFSANEIAGNSATTGDGGGIYATSSGVTMRNNLVYNNNASAGDGGAVYAWQAAFWLEGDTVYGNTAASGFPGLYADTGSGASLEVRNSIVWGHRLTMDIYGADVISYCDTEDTNLAADNNTGIANNIHVDPGFIDLDTDDYRLRVGSPCIDTAEAATAPSVDYYGTSRPQDGDANGTAKPDIGFFERPPLEPGRLWGANRYSTAVAVAKSAFDSAETVVLASGENFPDALSASSLAGAYEGPLLLTRASELSGVVLPALEDLGASRVVIVGGTSAVSDSVAKALTTAGYDVDRVWGSDRYATAAEVAREVERLMGLDFSEVAFVARGDNFPDALAVAPFAYSAVVPIVLTKPTQLPYASADVIGDLGISEVYIAGGTVAISTAVENKIASLTGGKDPVRWAGSNRYDTAAIIAEYMEDDVPGSFAYVGVARGDEFPDALAGGVATGSHGGVILLTKPTTLPPESGAALKAHKLRVVEVDVFGGPVAVSETVKQAVDSALGW